MTRAFVSIPMPEDTAARLAALTRGTRGGRRVPDESLHLTLAFLGDQPDGRLEDVHAALGEIRAAPVEIAFTGPGVFGTPPVLWIGVAPGERLVALHRAVLAALRRAGVQPEARRFMPHVTLVRFPARGGDAPFPGDRTWAPVPPFQAAGFSLMASELRPDGARYEELASYFLGP